MPTGSSKDETGPPGTTEPPPSRSGGNSWLAQRVRYPAAWAAAGLIVFGGTGAYLAFHPKGGRQPKPTAFCGLVACTVLRADAAAAGHPRSAPVPTPSALASKTPAVTPAPKPTAAPAPMPAPVPTTAPTAAPSPTFTPPPRSPPPRRPQGLVHQNLQWRPSWQRSSWRGSSWRASSWRGSSWRASSWRGWWRPAG
jgi:hypothetical protein